MSAAARALPPFKTLAAALRCTTEHLARELVRPSGSPPDWNELEWAVARSAAAMQGISVLLADRLRWRGPSAWEQFLVQQREQSLLREALIGRLIERVDSAIRRERIGCVALKGAALRTLDCYAPGQRPMGDVDMLVEPADVRAATAAMHRLGYVQASLTERHAKYMPGDARLPGDLGEHADNPIPIEIHTSIAERLPARRVDITAQVRPELAAPGVNGYRSRGALLLHLLLHAAGNMKAHALRLIQLHDIAALTARFGEADWRDLLGATDDPRGLWWAFPPLALTARYYDYPLPSGLLAALRRECPRMLRRSCDRAELTDVSWSNLRISAVPGIAWSRTPVDALRYLRSRALPRRRDLAAFEGTLRQQPHLRVVPWYQLSHGTRIVRWLLSRPPRVQTMMSVSAALRDSGPGGETARPAVKPTA